MKENKAMNFNGNNPWDVGGAMHRQLPWVQESMDYGWNTGNAFFQPKTKEQVRREALLQLAVLAAVIAAPAVIGAAKAAGAKLGLGKAGGAATGAEAPGAALTQGSVPPGVAPGGLDKLAALGKAGLRVAGEALRPFADPQRGPALQAAAELGVAAVLRELAGEGGGPIAGPGGGGAPQAGSVKLLERVVEKLEGRTDFRRLGDRVAREFARGSGERAMAQLRQQVRVRQALVPVVMEVAEELGMEGVWEGTKNNFTHHQDAGQTPSQVIFPNDPKYSKSVQAVRWFDIDEIAYEKAKRDYYSAGSDQEKLDVIKKYYRQLVKIAKQDIGWNTAADHLAYFLDGIPDANGKLKPKCVDPQFLVQFSRVRSAVGRGMEYIFYGREDEGFNEGLTDIANSISVGTLHLHSDYWEAGVRYPSSNNLILGDVPDMDLWDELAYAMGGFTIEFSHQTQLNRQNANDTTFNGTVSIKVTDDYDWHVGKFIALSTGNVVIDDEWAQKLVDNGLAHTFTMESELKLRIYGMIRNGKISTFTYEYLKTDCH
ncbi:MAG: hypothetical protein AAGN35_28180 [Bacteroidota bacterium]